MNEIDEVARVLADAYKAKTNEHSRSVAGARAYVREQMNHESYNVIDQVEYAVECLLWPEVNTQDIPKYY